MGSEFQSELLKLLEQSIPISDKLRYIVIDEKVEQYGLWGIKRTYLRDTFHTVEGSELTPSQKMMLYHFLEAVIDDIECSRGRISQ